MSIARESCFTTNHRNPTAFLPGKVLVVSFKQLEAATGVLAQLEGAKCYVFSIICLPIKLNLHDPLYLLWAYTPGQKHLATHQVCHLSRHCLHQNARLPSTEAPRFLVSCIWVWGWIQHFNQCVCFLLCHTHDWQVQPGRCLQRKSSCI